MLDITQLAFSLFTSSVGGAVAGCILNHYLPLKFKAEIDHQSHTRRAAYEIKREACLNALSVVDAHLSHLTFDGIKPVTQGFSIAEARRAHSHLMLTCDNKDVPTLFEQLLGLHNPNDAKPVIEIGKVRELRMEMRKELGLSPMEDLESDNIWITSATGAK